MHLTFLYKILLGSLLLFLVSGPTHAQSVLRTQADVQQIVIGDPVTVTLEVEVGTAASTVSWPALSEEFGGLSLLEPATIDTPQRSDQIIYREQFRVTAFDSGSYYLPSFKVVIHQGAGKEEVLYSDSLLINVQTIAVDTTLAFKPIKDIVPVRMGWADYWKIILARLLLLGLLGFILYYFYKHKRVKAPEAVLRTPPEKAHEKAFRLLASLKEAQYAQQGKVKLFYSELSSIVRNYLDDRFGLNCMEQTTDELMALLKKQTDDRAVLRKVRPDLKKILRTADLVKFAKADPDLVEHETCYDAAMKLVTLTQIKPEEGRAS